MKILAFGASSSKHSINRQFASWVANLLSKDVELLDLNDFEMELFSVDRETEKGYPPQIDAFYQHIENAELLVISMTEHNGSYSAAYKNLMDWTSRKFSHFFQDKPVFLLSTSTGKMGASRVMEAALSRFPRHGAQIIAHFSLPLFPVNFQDKIIDNELANAFNEQLELVKTAMKI